MCLTYTRHEHSKLFVTDYFTPFPRTTLVQKLRPGELLDDKKVKTDPDPLIISYLITKIIFKPELTSTTLIVIRTPFVILDYTPHVIHT